MAGLTSTGFQKKTLAEIKAEIEDSFRTAFGRFINLLPGSVFQTIIGIYAEREAAVWDLAEEVYYSQYPDTAQGVNLDNAAGITGSERLDAAPTRTLKQLFFGTPGTVIPTTFQASIDGNSSARFQLESAVTLGAGADEVQTLLFGSVPGSGVWRLKYKDQETAALAYNAPALDVQNALNALLDLSDVTVTGNYGSGFVITFAGANGKQDQPLLVVSQNTTGETTTVTQTTAGVPQASGFMRCLTNGPIPAPARTLTIIETPIFGLDSTTNVEDGIVGRNVEVDSAFKLRRRSELQKAGSSTVEAIRSKLREVENVTQAIVFENDDNVVDVNGLPPKSFRAYVQGGEDQDIFDAIWANKPGGIRPDGDQVGTVVDSQGISQTVRFSRPVVKDIYITIEITKDFDFPDNGAAQVRDLLANYINSLEIGDDVIVFPRLICTLDEIPGIVDVRIGIASTPAPALGTDDNIVVAINEVAKVLDAEADISVTVI